VCCLYILVRPIQSCWLILLLTTLYLKAHSHFQRSLGKKRSDCYHIRYLKCIMSSSSRFYKLRHASRLSLTSRYVSLILGCPYSMFSVNCLGIGIGVESAVIPVYAAGTVPHPIRGTIVMLWQVYGLQDSPISPTAD